MITTIQTKTAKPNEIEFPQGMVLDEKGIPVGSISLSEWISKLDRMLISHYGEDFRQMLNPYRQEQGMRPL